MCIYNTQEAARCCGSHHCLLTARMPLIRISAEAFLSEACMFSPCMHGFSLVLREASHSGTGTDSFALIDSVVSYVLSLGIPVFTLDWTSEILLKCSSSSVLEWLYLRMQMSTTFALDIFQRFSTQLPSKISETLVGEAMCKDVS